MRTTIREIDERHVEFSFDSTDTGERETWNIWAPEPRGDRSTYIRVGQHDGRDRQLCAGMSFTGPTLSYYPGTRLVDTVRREYRTMRREERRERAQEHRLRYGYR